MSKVKIINIIGLMFFGGYMAHLGHDFTTKEFWIMMVILFVINFTERLIGRDET